MKWFKYALSAAAVLCLANGAAAADKYMIDKVHSNLGFSVKHNMVSTVRGNFTDFTGEIMLDAMDMTKSTVMVTIKTASISTGAEGRDNHLKSPDFFDAATYPEITFKSTRIEKKSDGWVAHGMFTMHGVTKEIALPFNFNGPFTGGRGKLIGVDASTMINRQDYGVKWSRVLDFGVVVSDEVKIDLSVEANEAKQ